MQQDTLELDAGKSFIEGSIYNACIFFHEFVLSKTDFTKLYSIPFPHYQSVQIIIKK